MPETLFTPAEAAVLTRQSIKSVNNAIDKKTVPAISTSSAERLLDRHGLISLALERRLADRLTPDLRRQIFAALPRATRNTINIDDGFLKIDLREPRRELAASLRELRRAKQLIHSDPEICGGDPVFRGTRIPVHMIADILAQGETLAALLESYPRLTAEMARLAPLYAAAYPLRGRPRKQPWHDRPPVSTWRIKLPDLPRSS